MRLAQVISDYIRRSILNTQGDLVVRGAALPESLAAGADRTYLRGQGAGIIPAYEAEPTIPACRALLSANQSVASGTWTKVLFDIIDYDTTDNYNTGLSRYICTVPGLHLINYATQIADLADAKYLISSIYVNNIKAGGYCALKASGTASVSTHSSDILSLALNNYVEIYLYHNHVANRNINGGSIYKTFVSIHRLS